MKTKLTLILLIMLVGISCVVSGCVSGAVRSLRKVEPTYALWHGPWQSTAYSAVHGTVAARLPNDIAVGQEIEVPVAFSSSLLSIWRPGKTFIGRCRGVLKEAGQAVATHSPTNTVRPEDVKVLGLTQYDGQYDFVDRYVIQFNTNMTEATGFWVSNDGDRGTFSLKKERVQQAN
jgi:hypothetical protein